MALWIRDTNVLTLEGGPLLEHHDVYIEGNRIAKILPTGQVFDAQEIDGRGCILLPGLVNAHTHAGMSIFRNYGNDVDLMCWLEDYIWPLEDQLTPDDIYWASLLSIAEMLRTGTTCFADMYFSMDRVALAVKESGIRAQLSRGMSAPDPDGSKVREVRELAEDWDGQADGRIRIAVGPHAIYTMTTSYFEELRDLAEELQLPLHVHLAETMKEWKDCQEGHGMSPTAYLDSLGILKEDTLLAHCVWMSDEDLQILKKRGSTPVFNPSSNMKLASGFQRTEKMLQMGIPVALGTDGASSNNNLNLFNEMRIGSLIAKGITEDPKALTAEETLQMATRAGAKALGFPEVGVIREGALADLILVKEEELWQWPPADPYATLVYSTYGNDVTHTIVDGKLLYEKGEFLTLDIDRIKSEVEQRKKRLMK